MRDVIQDAAHRAARYLEGVGERGVAPTETAVAALSAFDRPLNDDPVDPGEVVRELDEVGSPGTVTTAGPRFYGFVIGGTVPASVGAQVLASAWDQNAGLRIASPTVATLEDVAGRWLCELLGIDTSSAVGFVTGATMANFTAVCAARHALLRRAGWDVEAQGLYGAPELRVIVGEHVHSSVRKALVLSGLGRDRVITVPADDQGRMLAAELPALDERTLVLTQAGDVNSGVFDPVGDICTKARDAGAWVHVDGAFGLWAKAAPDRAHLAAGVELADSWATDCHKWLNVPYDSGVIICRDGAAVRAGMAASAPYLIEGDQREPYHYTPELSRRGRGIEVYAALRSLGRSGVAQLIERCCVHATRFADGLRAAGAEILNDVVLNQVMVVFDDEPTTKRTIELIQRDGTCWCGGTTWRGRHAMRISVSGWATTEHDVEISLDAMLRCAREAGFTG